MGLEEFEGGGEKLVGGRGGGAVGRVGREGGSGRFFRLLRSENKKVEIETRLNW